MDTLITDPVITCPNTIGRNTIIIHVDTLGTGFACCYKKKVEAFFFVSEVNARVASWPCYATRPQGDHDDHRRNLTQQSYIRAGIARGRTPTTNNISTRGLARDHVPSLGLTLPCEQLERRPALLHIEALAVGDHALPLQATSGDALNGTGCRTLWSDVCAHVDAFICLIVAFSSSRRRFWSVLLAVVPLLTRILPRSSFPVYLILGAPLLW